MDIVIKNLYKSFGDNVVLNNVNAVIKHGQVTCLMGQSGVGKTTVANIIASRTGKTLHRLNATNASVSDIKDIVSTLDSFLAMDGVLLYLDETQHFNKKQQQSLLEYMENGKITAVGTHNELLSSNSIYQELYNSQNKAGDDNG